MHDGVEIVEAEIVSGRDVLREIVGLTGLDVIEIDDHVTVPIFPCMLMPKTPGMADLVDHIAFAAGIADLNRLRAFESLADIGGAGAGTGRAIERDIR